MNPVCEDIKDMMVDSNLAIGDFAATTGWSIHLTDMPDDDNTPDTCILVLDTGGDAPDPDSSKNIGNPTFQVLVRGTKMGYQDTWDKAKEILDGLHGKHNETWNNTRYIHIFAKSDILPLGYDENRRPMFSINFSVMRTE